MRGFIHLLWLASKSMRVCFQQSQGSKQLAKSTIIAFGSLLLMLFGVIMLTFSGYFLLVSMFYSPALATFIIACVFIVLAAIGGWFSRHIMHERAKHSTLHCMESVARSFMDGYSSSKAAADFGPRTFG